MNAVFKHWFIPVHRQAHEAPWTDRSREDAGHRHNAMELPAEVGTRFRRANALDYQVHDYCVERFEALLK